MGICNDISYFFHNLYGEVTISRSKLCITDDDAAKWGLLEDCIKMVSRSKGSLHMVCMFCALTLVYYENLSKASKIQRKCNAKGKSVW